MSGMPAFDGRRAGAWQTVTPTNGWTGAVRYLLRNGMCTVVLDLVKPAWGAEVMAVLPPEAWLCPITGVGPYSAGMSRDTGGYAPFYVDNSGNIGCVFGSASTGGGGIVGTVTYPAR